jgi:DNA-binding transcriptional ArsR family regulator
VISIHGRDAFKAFMDIETIEKNASTAVNLLKALSNERRLIIVCALYGGEKSVGELEKVVHLSQSALSQHLARLRREGIVGTRRSAQTIHYSLSDKSVEKIMHCLSEVLSEKG